MDKIRKIRIVTVCTTVFSCIMLGLGAVIGSISAYIFIQMNQVPSFDTIGMDSTGKLTMSPFMNRASTPMFYLVCVSMIGVGIGIVIINIIPCITGIQTYNMIKCDGISEHECMELWLRLFRLLYWSHYISYCVFGILISLLRIVYS